MGKVSGMIAVVAVLQAHAAAAQPQSSCPACRANIPFQTCSADVIENPPARAIGIVGQVLATEPVPCRSRLSVAVHRVSRDGVPAQIHVDVGPCLYWAGKTNDVVNALVFEEPEPGTNIYALRACYR